jgi:hypothetical protein
VRWLVNFVVKVREWPFIPQWLFRLWFASGVLWLVDMVFSFGVFAILPAWLGYVCAAPISLIFGLVLIDMVVGWVQKLNSFAKGGKSMADAAHTPNEAETPVKWSVSDD